jgi:hypothetical protein
MRTRHLIGIAVAIAALTGATIALAAGGSTGQASKATTAYHDVQKAIAAGYSFRLPDSSGATCIAQKPDGAMGVHLVNKKLLDAKIDVAHPEAMVYAPRKDGTLELAAIEYVVFQSAWKGSKPPTLFGREFALTPEPNRYGLPAFYALHAWLFKKNPSGLLNAWNPKVTCK